MRTLKVFEDLPNNISKAFFKALVHNNVGNNCYVKWYVEEEKPERECTASDEDYNEWIEEYNEEIDARTVDKWLLDQGCKSGEMVLMEHMW